MPVEEAEQRPDELAFEQAPMRSSWVCSLSRNRAEVPASTRRPTRLTNPPPRPPRSSPGHHPAPVAVLAKGMTDSAITCRVGSDGHGQGDGQVVVTPAAAG